MNNEDVRKWYVEEVSKIADNIDKNLPFEQQAAQAFKIRNATRKAARSLMADTTMKEKLNKEHPSKTFEELLESKMKRKGMTREEAIADILKTSTKTNEDINRELGIGGE